MEYNYPKFTPEMKKTHTILIPNMAITQFRLLEYALRYDGYKCEILGNCVRPRFCRRRLSPHTVR